MSTKPSLATSTLTRRKVGWSLVVLAAIAATAFLAMRNFASVNRAPDSPADERLVWIGTKTILLTPDQLGREMAEWYNSSEEATLVFELSDLSFVPNSSEVSPVGLARVRQIARLMQDHSAVTTHIAAPVNVPSPADKVLDDQRAVSFRGALVAQGVDASRVTIVTEDDSTPTARESQIVVHLMK